MKNIMSSKTTLLFCLIVKIFCTKASIIPNIASTNGKLKFMTIASLLNNHRIWKDKLLNLIFLIAIPEKTCVARAQEVSQFNGCSVPDWIPKELVNTHGDNIFHILSNHMLGSTKPSKINYARLFETDCNKHDICYGCVSINFSRYIKI